MRFFVLNTLLFLAFFASSQNTYDVANIDPALSKNAYVVTRMDNTIVKIPSIESMTIYRKVANTILNKKGAWANTVSMTYREGAEKIKNYKINIYDANGDLVKKVKKRDIMDHSIYDGSMASDVRALSYTSTYTRYPYTIEYEYEEVTSYTTFIPTWWPYRYYRAVEESTFTIEAFSGFDYKYLAKNCSDIKGLDLSKAPNSFSATNLKPIAYERLAPTSSDFFPHVRFSPSKSKMDKTVATYDDWKTFGRWMYNAYLKDKSNLSSKAKQEVAKIISGKNSDFEKAKAIYEYAVNSTRYVSIQLGEGGWEPFYADDTHQKKYGDCKALSMYTLAMMEEAGLDPFYVVIDAGNNFANGLEQDFASIQGNHAIIGVPIEGDTIFADCTTSKSPFGYFSSFTDGRYALAVNEEGGEIVATNKYTDEENYELISNVSTVLPENNLISLSVENQLSGNQISERLSMQGSSEKDIQEKIYPQLYPSFSKEKFRDIKGERTSHKTYEESFSLDCKGLLSSAGNYLLLPVHYYPISFFKIDSKERQTPIYIKYGFSKTYEYAVNIPEGYIAGELIEDVAIESEFGKFELRSMSEQSGAIIYKIKMFYKSGTYDKSLAIKYNDWIEEIKNIEGKRIILKPTNK